MPGLLVTRVLLVGIVTLGIGACASTAEDRTEVSAVTSGVPDQAAPTTSESTTTMTTSVLDPLSPEVVLLGFMARARSEHVLGVEGAVVVLSSCPGGSGGASHWGYYNNGAAGGEVREPDGVVVPVGAVCINPVQPDMYSNLLHNLGLKYLWEKGLWDSAGATFGGSERAAECFAAVFGATVFGEGGCSADDVQRMRILLGL